MNLPQLVRIFVMLHIVVCILDLGFLKISLNSIRLIM